MNNFDVIVIDQNKATVIEHNRKKLSRNILTKYEKTTLIGVRVEQLSYGCVSTLTNEQKKDCQNIREMAESELKLGVIPLMLCRHLPNKTEEYWKIKDLIIV
jgi:DNA-directed RNA polymerase subunit K/omega